MAELVCEPFERAELDDAFALPARKGLPTTRSSRGRGQIDYPVPPMPEDSPERRRRRRRGAFHALVAANPDASIGGGPAAGGGGDDLEVDVHEQLRPVPHAGEGRGTSGTVFGTSTRHRRRSRQPSGITNGGGGMLAFGE